MSGLAVAAFCAFALAAVSLRRKLRRAWTAWRMALHQRAELANVRCLLRMRRSNIWNAQVRDYIRTTPFSSGRDWFCLMKHLDAGDAGYFAAHAYSVQVAIAQLQSEVERNRAVRPAGFLSVDYAGKGIPLLQAIDRLSDALRLSSDALTFNETCPEFNWDSPEVVELRKLTDLGWALAHELAEDWLRETGRRTQTVHGHYYERAALALPAFGLGDCSSAKAV